MSQKILNGLVILSIESHSLQSLDYKIWNVFASKITGRHHIR